MTRDTDSYKAELYQRMPRGSIWPRSINEATVWDSLLDSMALEFARVRYDIDAWLADFFPDSTVQQLPDWERLLGLPDCDLALGTEAERRGAVVARLRRRGNPTLANIQTLADSFDTGAVVSTGGTSDLFFVGTDEVDGANVVANDDLATTVLVTYDAPQSDSLECALRHALPVHLTVTFTVV
jgi:hypothetical protein